MMCRRFAAPALALAMAAGSAFGIDVTRPGDLIVGSSANFPAGEPPSAAIDNSANSKYLNFDRVNTGFTVTPTGTGVVRYLTIITANDSPARDPMSFTLEGSDDGVSFTSIGAGAIASPTSRFTLVSSPVAGNEATYGMYRVVFPTIRDANATNSMQVAEVQLSTAIDISSPSDIVTIQYSEGSSSNPNEGPANLFDNRIDTKLDVLNAQSGPSMVTVTPAIGPTVLTGFAYFSGNDDVAFPGRTPQNITIEGSNDGVDFTQLYTTPVVQATANFQDQEFAFENNTAYLQYRITFDVPYTSTDMQVGEMQLFGVASDEPPTNDTCSNARVATPGTISGATLNATGSDTTGCGSNDSADVWYSYTATATGLVEANTCGSTSDTTLAVFSSCKSKAIACDDNSCGLQSVVRWEATAGQTYLIRVALTNNETGTFRFTLDNAPVVHTDVTLQLARNFNGMVHIGESNQPDSPTGYRAIADRGLFLDGAAGSLDAGAIVNAERMPYEIERTAGPLDIVLLGDRNTVDGGNYAFDPKADGDDHGIQPDWLPSSDLSGPQTTDLTTIQAFMGADTQVGFLYQISNGGGTFDLTLGFGDKTSVTVSLSGPDWFNDQSPVGPGPGVATQRKFGVFRGAGQLDFGTLDNNLNVAEAIVTTQSLIDGGFGDVTGRQLTSVTFSNRGNTNASYAIVAATIRDPGDGTGPCAADFNDDDVVNSQDFFDFLAAFFDSDPSADFNEDNVVNSQDFFDFLTAFFAGC